MMRKLKLQSQISMDGFIAGPNGEMDWMTFPWTSDIENYVNELTEPVSTIILGRKLAEGFIPHWAGVAAGPNNEEQASGKKYTETEKIVFTNTLSTSDWPNTKLANGKLSDEVRKLKEGKGGDIIVYGGSQFVSSLIKEKLIDELHLFINPTILGKGLPIFQQVAEVQKIELANTIHFKCGIVLLKYTIK